MLHSKNVLLTLIVLTLGACGAKEEVAAPAPEPERAPAPEVLVASATLAPRSDTTATGKVTFTQEGDTVTIEAHIEGVPAGAHGFHIHAAGDCSAPDFTSAGGHFNPGDSIHGAPSDDERHAGDLGNVEAGESGVVHVVTTSDRLTVADGPNSVVGRGVILHEKADDLVSQPTGAAGSRLACGVVEAGG